jgi:Zn-dependent alcohol dehydrogenase
MSNMMRALVKAKAEPGIWMERVPVPEIGPNDVLIKVRKSAICGTDVHIYNWDKWAEKTVPVPMVTGHEFVGTVAEVGSAVSEYKVGQRVSGEGHIVCGHCRNCRAGRGHLCRNTQGVGVNRPGSFAEYVAIPQHNVVPIPDDVPDEIAAIFDSATPSIPRCPSTLSARMCWSPAPGRSASWARWSPRRSARARWSSPISIPTGSTSPARSASITSSTPRKRR